MIFFHFFIFINLVTVTDRGVKVGQDDQKLVKMTNLTITPPISRAALIMADKQHVNSDKKNHSYRWKASNLLNEK